MNWPWPPVNNWRRVSASVSRTSHYLTPESAGRTRGLLLRVQQCLMGSLMSFRRPLKIQVCLHQPFFSILVWRLGEGFVRLPVFAIRDRILPMSSLQCISQFERIARRLF